MRYTTARDMLCGEGWIGVATRPSDKLVRFAAGINRGLSGAKAAEDAGYGSHVIGTPGPTLDRARAAGLILTIEEARAPLDLIKAAVTPEDWTAIGTKAVEQAKAGDPVARAWLADRLIGKVTQGVEHGGSIGLWLGFDPEIDEREHRNDQPVVSEG